MTGLGSDLDALLNNDALGGLVASGHGLDALIPHAPLTEAPTPDVAPVTPEITPEANTPFSEVEYTGNLETDTALELTAAQAAFRDRARDYKRQRLLVEDSEFWVAVCFRTREDKEAFLRDHGLLQLGDKYLNGYAVDAALTKET
jgi:hypothetical protein